ncbi:MAG: Trm112 family protein [Acidimicrobiales bacterium]
MALDPGLLEILACPDDKGPLKYFADEEILYNPRQIPVLLTSESTSLSEEERQRLDQLAGHETGSASSEE